jgi:DNA gyrase/topoisomerase IV subunit A
MDEIAEKQAQIAELTEILNNPFKLDEVVQSEFDYMKQKYGDERKTDVSDDTSLLNLSGSIKAIQAAADKIKEDVICWIGADYSMRVLYQSRIQTIPEETIDLIYTHNQDRLIVITDL